ncbi:MAG: SusC/RagA family TonB-linked outer membrane protein, partial [Bacteroidales bacterium]|nr:SusC/RagA family TonB-linked outer membrane protein [Bacteroidales bacterium]
MRRIRHYSLMLTVIFVIAAAFPRIAAAQKTGSVTCTISDDAGPLPGAVIRVKGTDNAAVSDLDGKASIAGINSTVTLVVTLLGYEDQQIEAGPGDNISVTLKEDRQMLDEVIVIGYGTAKRKDYTGSVASVRLENSPIAQAVNSNALESLKGNVSGLDIGATNTAGGQPSVQVRGQKNFSGASSPLIVLDGLIFMGGLNDINPADIATIDILKDASSAATYGSRSANGVIVITTKKGASHKPTITFNASYGAATWGNKPRMKTGQAYVDAIMARNNRTDLGWMSPQEYLNYQTGQTTDWLDYSSRIGSKQDYQLSVGGAGEGINYYFSTSFSDNKGIIIGDDFNRFNLLGKLSTDITSWLNISVDAAFTRQDYSGVAANILTAYYLSPYGAPYRYNTRELEKYPVTSSDGYQNPLWQADKSMRQDVDIRNNYRLQASAVIKAPWVEGLSLRLNYSYTDTRKNTSNFQNERYSVQEGRYDDDSRYSAETYRKLLSSASGWRKNEDTYSRLFDAILNYTHAFGKHDVDATLVATRDHSVYNMEQMTASNFYANGNTTLGINGLRKATVQKVSEDGVETANIG